MGWRNSAWFLKPKKKNQKTNNNKKKTPEKNELTSFLTREHLVERVLF